MDFKQGDFENILMNAVWDLEDSEFEQIDVSEVQARINSGEQNWAYTTVKTVLDRLVVKNMLERIKFNKKFFYKSRISREKAGRNAIEKLARQYFKGEIEDLVKAAEKVQAGMLVYR
jgi:BlaI family transcriptional regulator, penicillinase repressor